MRISDWSSDVCSSDLNHLIEGALDGAVLRLHDGERIGAEDLRRLVERARMARHSMRPLARKVGSAKVIAQAPIAGALNAERLEVSENAVQAARYLATRPDLLELPQERGWTGTADAEIGGAHV